MSDWVVVPSLVKLREEFNALSPNRDKGADGTIGDTNHTSSSDHTPDEDSNVLDDEDSDHRNEVHALDIDSSGPWPGDGTQKQRFDAKVKGIIAREKKRWLDPNDLCRLKYVIWDEHIYSAVRDFEPILYSGRADDPHTNHAHFSARYITAAENDTSDWGVAPKKEEPDVELNDKIGDKEYPNRTVRNVLIDLAKFRGWAIGSTKDGAVTPPGANSPLMRLYVMAKEWPEFSALMRAQLAADGTRDTAAAARIDAHYNELLQRLEGLPTSVADALIGGSDMETAEVLVRLLGNRREPVLTLMEQITAAQPSQP